MSLKISRLAPFGALVEATGPDHEVRDLNIDQLKLQFHKEHLIVLRGFRTFKSAEDFTQYCESWGPISIWPFGKVLELIEKLEPSDHIFDNNYVPLHWDGMYRPEVPEFQIFHCVNAPRKNQGGRTTFSNTKTAYNSLPERLRALCAQVRGVYERKMEFYHSKTIAPIITKHPTKDFSVIRYCEPPLADDQSFVNHPSIEFQGLKADDFALFARGIREALYAPENLYAHAWEPGDLVIADNHTLLHGREAFEHLAPRHLQRVHVLGQPPFSNPHLVFHS